jgi:hypothetical protein
MIREESVLCAPHAGQFRIRFIPAMVYVLGTILGRRIIAVSVHVTHSGLRLNVEFGEGFAITTDFLEVDFECARN